MSQLICQISLHLQKHEKVSKYDSEVLEDAWLKGDCANGEQSEGNVVLAAMEYAINWILGVMLSHCHNIWQPVWAVKSGPLSRCLLPPKMARAICSDYPSSGCTHALSLFPACSLRKAATSFSEKNLESCKPKCFV